MDEAAEFLGRCATRRVVGLTHKQACELMEISHLDIPAVTDSHEEPVPSTLPRSVADWWAKWGEQRLADLGEWGTAGATIGVVIGGKVDSHGGESVLPTLFLPCVLTKVKETCPRRLELLAEQRLVDCWKRLLEAKLANQ